MKTAATAQEWDFSFLRRVAPPSVSRVPLNIFDIAGFPRRETVASNVLGFFLDPKGCHGMGTLFVDSLMRLLDGAPLFERSVSRGARRAETPFSAPGNMDSRDWMVATEAPTFARNRIDVVVTNASLDLAIVIENKLDAPLANPLADYVGHVTRTYGRVLSVLFAPTRRALEAISEDDRAWLSDRLTFDEFFTRVLDRVTPETAEPRAFDLFEQFRTNVSAREVAVSSKADLDRVREFWRALEGSTETLPGFFGALGEVSDSLKRRAEVVREEVAGRLKRPGMPVLASTFVSAGFDHKWGVRAGWVTVVWLGFVLSDGVTIELVLGDNPSDYRDLFVKAYLTETGARDPLAGYSRLALQSKLDDSADVIANEFLETLGKLLSVAGQSHDLGEVVNN